MAHFSYANAPYQIRDDIPAAYREYWARLANPGSWWTGAQRIAIADESRRARGCSFCKARKDALSPYTMQGTHDGGGELPEIAVDAVHRIVTDQTRITQSYISGNNGSGLTEEAYVELLGVVVMVFSIDEFHRGLGLPLEPLPDPQPGQPTGYRPRLAQHGTGFVAMLPPDGAVGNESDLWQNGRTANVVRALTLVPNNLRDWKLLAAAQYLALEDMANMVGQDNRSINRMQMELVAGRVSAINECFY